MHDHAPDTRPATLHARIRAEVEARILSGEWKPGDRLPTETELMARHGYRTLIDEFRPPCCVRLGAEGHHLGQSRFIRSVHLADGSPVLIEDRHIFLDAVPDAATADFAHDPPGPWLLHHVPWTEAEHRISAIAAEPPRPRALEIDPATPCLLVEGRTWRGADTLTIARQVFRGDAFDLTARFGPTR